MENQYEDMRLSELLFEIQVLEERYDTYLLLGQSENAEIAKNQEIELAEIASRVSIAKTVLSNSFHIDTNGEIASLIPFAQLTDNLKQLTCDFNNGIENNVLKIKAERGDFNVEKELLRARQKEMGQVKVSMEYLGDSNLELLKMHPDYLKEMDKIFPYKEANLKELNFIIGMTDKIMEKYGGIKCFVSPEENQKLFENGTEFKYKDFEDAKKLVKDDFEKFANYVAADLMGESYSSINTVDARDTNQAEATAYDAKQEGNAEMIENAGGQNRAKNRGMSIDSSR